MGDPRKGNHLVSNRTQGSEHLIVPNTKEKEDEARLQAQGTEIAEVL